MSHAAAVPSPPTRAGGKPLAGPLVAIEHHGDIAVLTIDHPPVNALSMALRRALMDALEAVAADRTVRGAVIACAGRTFVAGADIGEFDAAPGAKPTIGTAHLCAALDTSTSRWSPRCSAPRWAAASSWRWPAMAG